MTTRNKIFVLNQLYCQRLPFRAAFQCSNKDYDKDYSDLEKQYKRIIKLRESRGIKSVNVATNTNNPPSSDGVIWFSK